MNLVTVSGFWKSRKDRGEGISVMVVVCGVKLVVMLYDYIAKTSHELWVSEKKLGSIQSTSLRIPEMHIVRNFRVEDVLRNSLNL